MSVKKIGHKTLLYYCITNYQFYDQNSCKLNIRNIEKSIGFLDYGSSKIFHSTIEIDQQDNVKSGAVNIIDEMKNMKKKSCAY